MEVGCSDNDDLWEVVEVGEVTGEVGRPFAAMFNVKLFPLEFLLSQAWLIK